MFSMQGPAVLELQLLLITRGFSPGPLDGIYGPKTGAAVERARVAAKLPPLSSSAASLLQWLRSVAPKPIELLRIRTPIASKNLAQALREGHKHYFDEEPSGRRLRMARAHCALEHGAAGLAIWVHNIGNIMTGLSYQGPWFAMTAVEQTGTGPKPKHSRWRAYAEPAEGAEGYWRLLWEHFPEAFLQFDHGTPAGFAHGLKQRGYYTAKEGDYAALLAACWRHLEREETGG